MKSTRFHGHEILQIPPWNPPDFMMPNEPRTNGPIFSPTKPMSGKTCGETFWTWNIAVVESINIHKNMPVPKESENVWRSQPFIDFSCSPILIVIFIRFHLRIQGAPPVCSPLRVQILSFWHTNFSKRSCLGSWCPPTRTAPPYGKSWIRHWFTTS